MATDRHNTVSGHVCPTCGKKLRRTDSYSEPGRGGTLYHLTCQYPPRKPTP